MNILPDVAAAERDSLKMGVCRVAVIILLGFKLFLISIK